MKYKITTWTKGQSYIPPHQQSQNSESDKMGDSSASYIHMVQHLIEKCLIFRMSKEECMEALSKHANIKPLITSIVWKELEKENKEFFESYSQSQSSSGASRMSEAETTDLIQKMISDNQLNKDDDDDE
ncbi:hypothetical protein L1887_23625 [Cichorium endivia]|nr:hypothetical protein L1887_23625 [Cichorium endivia]